jgi:hypothetical protein
MEENDNQRNVAPPGTPSWAMTVAFLSSVILTAFGTFYVSISPDIKSWLGNKKEIDLADIAARADHDKRVSESTQALVGWCTDQIMALTKAINTCGSERSEYQRSLTEKDASLNACKLALAKGSQ